MNSTSHVLNVFITTSTLLIFERLFAFSDSRIHLEAWVLVVALLFLIVSLIVFGGSIVSLVFEMLKNRVFLKWLRPIIVGVVFFVPMYFLGLQLCDGNWIKVQSWVQYFPALVGASSAFVSVAVYFLFDRIKGSQYQRGLGYLGILICIGLLYLHAEISGGVYHYVYLTLYILSTIALSLSVALINIKMKFKKISFVILGIILLGSIYTFKNIKTPVRANADVNSLTFSNLTRELLPAQKLNFLEKILVDESVIAPPKITVEKKDIRNADWNVLFVVVDTLRADIFEPWERGEITTSEETRFMDSFFKDSIHFKRGYSQASGTLLSMPSLFRSLEVNEQTAKVGRPLGHRFSGHGFRTFAVVNNFFAEPRFVRTRSLLDGFEDVKIYRKKTQNDLLKFTLQSFDQYQNEKWFAWIHFYNMHHTAFDGTFMLGVPKKEAYRRAAGWLDSQMKAIIADLKAKKLLSKTVIVFTSDHGESLGENGLKGHGRSVWEEEVRAPIAIRIPGVEGLLIDGTVGNIDLLPTLLDLLKLPSDPTLAGRSLVPFIANREAVPDRSYYISNVSTKQVAIVRGSEKLIFKSKKGILQRYNLDEDPKEEKDLFVGNLPKESRMRRDLVFHNPKIVKKELKSPEMKALLLHQIEKVAHDNNQSSLFYTKLVAQQRTKETADKISDKIVLKNNRDFSQHYRILCRSKFGRKVRDEMRKRIEKDETRIEMLNEIVDLHCPSFHDSWVYKMMEKAPPIERKYWLALSLHYTNKQRRLLLPLVNRWLQNKLSSTDRRLVYRNVSRMGEINKPPTALLENARRDLTADELTAERAIQVLGHLRDKDASNRLISILESSASIRVKQSILMALAKIKPENAFEIISKIMEEEPVLTFDGAKAILVLGDQRGIELLNRYGREYPNNVVRSNIKTFAKKLQKKIAKQKGK